MTYKKVTASSDDVFGGRPVRIHRVLLVAGSDAASVIAYDDSAASGSTKDFCKLHTASANTENDFSWGGDGITVSYLSVVLTGTNAVCYVYYS